MPELPEVETTVSDLKKKIVGLKIIDVWADAKRLIKKSSFEIFKKQIKNAEIKKIERRGKNILIHLNPKSYSAKSDISREAHYTLDLKILLIHQKLTGHLLYGIWMMDKGRWTPKEKGPLNESVNRFIHLVFFLNNGKMLALSDLRKFAKVVLGSAEEILNSKDIKELGPEPLEKTFTLKKFKEAVRDKKAKIKQVLMDQKVIAGIGNIYSDEILWQAKIHPFKPANKLKNKELKAIYEAMGEILEKAVKLRGTSISDFRDPEGRKGNYVEILSVYQREGEECPRCGRKVKRIKLGGRSAHYCPKCQKL